MIVNERYHLPREIKTSLRRRRVKWGFGTVSEIVFYRTYSRSVDGKQESWADTVIRVVEGVMSIRQDWYRNVLGKRWQAKQMDAVAAELAAAIFDMKLLPPGRGLWAMGTEYVYERGSHALNNCGAIAVERDLSSAARWLMDSLMCGVGVGFTTHTASLRKLRHPEGVARVYRVPDTKEGWAESVKRLIQTFERGGKPVHFDYSAIRAEGSPIRGFGGVSSGYAPLEMLHSRMRTYLKDNCAGKTSQTRLITDVMNAIGTCVVAGNVRRSAEIAIGSPSDTEFLDLKNYDLNPDRRKIGWMSNNSVALQEREDFELLPTVAERIQDNGEPGILNMLNVSKFGRVGEKRPDAAVAVNPCGEIPLESAELCNLVEVFPTRCRPEELGRILEIATFYAQTVSLLRSHLPETNEVVARNRRIGVSVSGVADWIDATSVSYVFDHLNRGYDVVRRTAGQLAHSAGVAEPVRVTTVKPSGTVSLLAGVSSGMHHPVSGYVKRRIRVAENSPVTELLREAGVPSEPDTYSDNTTVFSLPLRYGNGKTRAVRDVSVYEQAAIVAMLQRAWADNAVSNTLTFQDHERGQVERVLALYAPVVKSMSLLPARDEVYEQMPLEAVTAAEFGSMVEEINPVRWSALTGSDGDASDTAYCVGDACEIPQRAASTS